jgi:hypothetical protein
VEFGDGEEKKTPLSCKMERRGGGRAHRKNGEKREGKERKATDTKEEEASTGLRRSYKG